MKYQIGDRIKFKGDLRSVYPTYFDLDEILEGTIIDGDIIHTMFNGERISLGEYYLVDVDNTIYMTMDSNIIERVVDLNDIEYYLKGEI